MNLGRANAIMVSPDAFRAYSKDSLHRTSHRESRLNLGTPVILTYFLHTSNGKHYFFKLFREVQWFFNIFDQKTLKHYYSKRKCTSTPVQIGPNLANSEFALRDHKVLPDATKQSFLLREFFSHQILEKKLTCKYFDRGYFSGHALRSKFCTSIPPALPQRYSDGGIP